MKNFVSILLLLLSTFSFSQVSDDFSNGNFTSPSFWEGDVESFITNSNMQLQLDAPKDASPAQLRLPSSRLLNTSWECWVKMDFNPTSANYTKIYLCSSSPDLTGELNGLFVRIGYTKKQISLVSQSGKTNKVLINGEEMRLNRLSVALNIKITLEKDGNLALYSKLDDEQDFRIEGNCKLDVLPQSNYFGIVCVYSATRRNLFFFDDFAISPLSDDEGSGDDSKGDTPIENVKVSPDMIAGTFRIEYNFSTYNNYCRLMVFDSGGRRVSIPYNNEMIGSEGALFWNGKEGSGQMLKRGIYIIYMEVYQPDGKVSKYKLPVVVQ